MTPVAYSDALETRASDEDEIVAQILEMMRNTQAAGAERHRHALRDAHAKSHAILKGVLRVHGNLPPELAQGVFATAREYAVAARLSSAPGDIHSDEIPAPRGFAIKLIGVDGARLSPDIEGRNQDFLMVNFPVLAFGTVQRYRQMLGLLERNAHAPAAVQRAVAATARGVEHVVEAVGATPGATLQGLARDNHHMLGESFFTQAAVRFGDYVAKLSLQPASENVRELHGQDISTTGFSAMRDAVCEFFARDGARYTLCAQLLVDPERMPVEDASVDWDTALSPFQPVATLEFGPQRAYTPTRQVYGDDTLSFNPWNGVQAHRPLGSIMRVRKAAYDRSTRFRHDMNARPRTEPASLQDIPD